MTKRQRATTITILLMLAIAVILLILAIAVILLLFFGNMPTAHAQGDEDAMKPVITVQDIQEVEKELQNYDKELDMLAKMLKGEAEVVKDKMNVAAVVWCALNRVDKKHRGTTIAEVVSADAQFAYNPNAKIVPRLRDLAADVVKRWLLEKKGFASVGRVLPKRFLFMSGNGKENNFRTTYRIEGTEWYKWTLPNPYVFDGVGGAW